jgi:hypothetical protein
VTNINDQFDGLTPAILKIIDGVPIISRWRESIYAEASIDLRQRRVPNEPCEEGSPAQVPETRSFAPATNCLDHCALI